MKMTDKNGWKTYFLGANPPNVKIIGVNSFLDWVLVRLIRRRWGKLYQTLSDKKITCFEYSKRRRFYESMVYEVEKNDL